MTHGRAKTRSTTNAAADSTVAATSGADLGANATPEIAGYFDAYASFARTLRTWLVGFGVGVPVLVASQAELSKKLAASGDAKRIVTLFLGGVAVQIFVTMLYKSAMWYTYFGAMNSAFRGRWRYKASEWISEQHWLEVIFDVATMALFVAAMFSLLRAVFA